MKNTNHGFLFKKKQKNPNLSDSNFETEENKFSKDVVIESLENIPLSKLSPFFIEMVITSISNPKSVKKISEMESF